MMQFGKNSRFLSFRASFIGEESAFAPKFPYKVELHYYQDLNYRASNTVPMLQF